MRSRPTQSPKISIATRISFQEKKGSNRISSEILTTPRSAVRRTVCAANPYASSAVAETKVNPLTDSPKMTSDVMS